MEEPIKVLSFCGFYLPGYKGGGPIKTIKNLFDQAGESILFRLVTSDRDLGDKKPYDFVSCGAWNEVGNVLVFYTQSGLRGFCQIYKAIHESKCNVVYLNSFFSIRFSFFPLLISRFLGKKVVLGPRGEFSSGALSLKSRKKRLFIKLHKLLNLHRGIVFQASSQYEADDIRRVLGDAVDIRIAEDIGAQEFAKEFSERSNSPLKVICLARISPMKNLLAALDMLNAVQQPIEYEIYGPIEDREYWAQCISATKKLPPHIKVKYKGELQPDQVICTLADYDLFFMPTKGENYGHVIAEALCAGLPILIADTTPWRNLQEQGIGWDLSLDTPEQFSSVIDQIALMATDERHRMRLNVLAWAKKKFSQRDAVDANIAMFRYAHEKK